LGDRRSEICRDFGRATSWFDEWWAKYQHKTETDFADHSRAPHLSPQRVSPSVEEAIIAIRSVLDAAATPETKYGVISAAAIRGNWNGCISTPYRASERSNASWRGMALPIPWGWQRAGVLSLAHCLDGQRHSCHGHHYPPYPGGEEIQDLRTIDHFSHAMTLTQEAAKSSAIMCALLRKSWAKMGRPFIHQIPIQGVILGCLEEHKG